MGAGSEPVGSRPSRALMFLEKQIVGAQVRQTLCSSQYMGRCLSQGGLILRE
jgi:hypothetical protein